MSYGVVASKPAQVQVEHVATDERPTGGPLRRKRSRTGASPWGSGKLTLTSLHLNFVPRSTAPEVPALRIALSDIVSVTTSSDRLHKTVVFRTHEVVLRVRVTGTAAFARRVELSVENNRKRSAAQGGIDLDPSIRSTS